MKTFEPHFDMFLEKYKNDGWGLSKNGIDTMVPPHSVSDVELWGNNPKLDNNWGFDKNAHSLTYNNHLTLKNQIVTTLINKGWKTIKTQ